MTEQQTELCEKLWAELAEWQKSFQSFSSNRKYMSYFLHHGRCRYDWEHFFRGFASTAPYHKHDASQWLYKSLDSNEAVREDWAAIGQDICKGIEAALRELKLDGRIEPARTLKHPPGPDCSQSTKDRTQSTELERSL
jgi:hypothetical protein